MNRIKKVMFWGLFCLLGTGISLPALVQGMDIVKEGEARAKIVLPDQPEAQVIFAAEELQYHIRRASGVKLEIISERKATEEGAYIFIGSTKASARAGIKVAELEPKEFIKKVTPEAMFLVGDDGPGGGTTFRRGLIGAHPPDMGTLFAVYEWLDNQLGVRWLWPGELGTVVPQLDQIAAGPLGEERVTPRFMHTRLRYGAFQAGNWRGAMSKEAFEKLMLDTGMWLRRHRLVAGPTSFEYGHAFTRHWERFGETHPEWFAMRPDGIRAPDGAPQHVQMCVSNPEFHQQIVTDWLKHRTPLRPWINCNENDKHADPRDPACHCLDCRAWDVWVDEEGVVIDNPYLEIEAGEGKWLLPPSITDRHARFWLAVQTLARKHDPDATIIAGAYAGYTHPPIKTKLNENIIIRVVPTHGFPSGITVSPLGSWALPGERDDFKKLWDGWAKTGARLLLRPNYTLIGYSMPYIFAREFGEEFRHAAAQGMVGTDFDSLIAMWAVQGPNLYMLARLHEKPEMEVDEVLAEYWAGFGPAAAAVQAYFDYWEEFIRDAFKHRTGWWAFYHGNADKVFPLEALGKGARFLERAEEATVAGSVYRRRVEFLQKGLKHAKLTVQTITAHRQHRHSPFDAELAQAFYDALNNLDEFRAQIEKDHVVDLPFLAWQERRLGWGREAVRMLADFELVRQLPLFWQFKWDPEEIGSEEKWFAENLDTQDWLRARTDKWWEDQRVGEKRREKDGRDFDGLAWYRTTFTVSPDFKGRRLSLYFGAVDEACIIWVNDYKLLERPFPYRGDTDSWRKPFTVDITRVVRFDRPNTVVVQVEDRAGAGGIWKPVSIVAD